MTRHVLTGAAALFVLAAPALAAPEGGFLDAQREGQLLASELMGVQVIDAEDDNIGDIHDLILDPRGGIFGAVVSVGGFLSIGAKEVALSWNEFRYVPEEQIAHLNVTREQLEEAPDFRTLAEMQREEEGAQAAQRARREMQGLPASSTY